MQTTNCILCTVFRKKYLRFRVFIRQSTVDFYVFVTVSLYWSRDSLIISSFRYEIKHSRATAPAIRPPLWLTYGALISV